MAPYAQSDPVLTSERDGAVALVTLNRPAARNALSLALQEAIFATFTALKHDRDIAAIVLAGAGPHAFCAGLDLKEIDQGIDLVNLDFDPVAAVANVGKPVIAAVNGAAITGGLELMLACDMVICADNALFTDTHANMQVSPGWGLSQRLSRRIGIARALEMSLSARPVDAQTAADWGLVNRCVSAAQLIEQAMALAHRIAAHDRRFVAHYRSLILNGADCSLPDALAREKAVAQSFNRGWTRTC